MCAPWIEENFQAVAKLSRIYTWNKKIKKGLHVYW